MVRGWLPLAGLVLALLVACAPRLVLEPKVPLPQVEVGKGQVTVPQWVLPGNPLPFADNFESYGTGAVLTRVASDRYGLLGSKEASFTVTEVVGSQKAVTKAVRLAWYDGSFLTTGAKDWTNYRLRLEAMSLGDWYWPTSGILFRVFLDPSGTRALEFRLGLDGVELTKVLGEQRQVMAKRPELRETGRRFVTDKMWHRFEVVARSTGEVWFGMDGGELLSWQDPDFRQGGLGFGAHGPDVVLYLDNLEVTPLSEPPKAP